MEIWKQVASWEHILKMFPYVFYSPWWCHRFLLTRSTPTLLIFISIFLVLDAVEPVSVYPLPGNSSFSSSSFKTTFFQLASSLKQKVWTAGGCAHSQTHTPEMILSGINPVYNIIQIQEFKKCICIMIFFSKAMMDHATELKRKIISER